MTATQEEIAKVAALVKAAKIALLTTISGVGPRIAMATLAVLDPGTLRRALADLLPEEILQRTKQPYRSPDSQSFFFDGKPLDYVADLMSADSLREAGYFDPVPVGRLMEKCRQGRATGFASPTGWSS